MGRMIGIDLGTTNSVVAVVDKGGCRVLQNKENEMMTRSAVGYYKGNFLVGSPAIRRWPFAPKDTVISIKRLMGRAVSDPEVERVKKWAIYDIVQPSDGTKDSVRVKIGGKEYSPVEVSAIILKKLKEDAEYVLGDKVTHAVITVPAYFSEKQKHATREAALKAGLTVMKIIDEPTASAIAFGIDSRESEAKTVLVYDLGGGTFDISVLMMTSGTFVTLDTEGDMWLGGDDFDQVIVDYCIDAIRKEHGIDPTSNLKFMAMLKINAREAKETLGQSKTALILIPGVLTDNDGEALDIEIEISQHLFEEMAMKLVQRTLELTKKAVTNANLEMDDIQCVIMTGNATAMPIVQNAMEKLFGKERILRKIHPKNSVAIGAAMTAATLNGVTCPKCEHTNENLDSDCCEKCGAPLRSTAQKKNCFSCGAENDMNAEKCSNCGAPFIKVFSSGIAPFSYGIETEGDRFNLFIEKGDGYETKQENIRVKTFHTRFNNQRIISIPVYGGDHLDCASKNEKQGEAFAILPKGYPEGTGIRIKLWLNKEGIFELSARLEDGTQLNPWILRGNVDQKAIEILGEAMNKIAQKNSVLSPQDKKQMDNMVNQVLADLEGGKFTEAKEEASALLDSIENAGNINDDINQQADGIKGYAGFIVNRYGWCIPSDVIYKINTYIGELDGAQRINDRIKIGEMINLIEEAAERILKQVDKDGTPIPGILFNMFMKIEFNIKERKPVEAKNLSEELDEVENAYKNKRPNAVYLLGELLTHLAAVLSEMGEEVHGIKCPNPKCNYINPEGSVFCAKCHANLIITNASKR